MMMMMTIKVMTMMIKLQLTNEWSDKVVHKFFFGCITGLNDFDCFRVTKDH